MLSDPDPAAIPTAVVERLYRAVNTRDLDAIVACFAPDYRNQTPAHPPRGFTGNDQVRRNWAQILSAVPNLRATVTCTTTCTTPDGDQVWIEAEHAGTRDDGAPHLLRGVIIFGVSGDMITSARFYLEPVESGSGDVDAAIRRQLHEPVTP
jgi:ketosteroid isomerase-like protein